MKIKSDITTNYFHDEFVKEFPLLNKREETSRRIYSRIIRLLFEYIKEQLYQGETFTTPFGFFKITKAHLNFRSPKMYVSHAATRQQGEVVYREKKNNYFHKLSFVVLPNMEGRYYFRPVQSFVRKIYKYYD